MKRREVEENCIMRSFIKLYSLPRIIRMIKLMRVRWTGHAARIGAMRNAYRILAKEPKRKRLLGRQRSRWVNNIKINL
jgi:hypothetical protein